MGLCGGAPYGVMGARVVVSLVLGPKISFFRNGIIADNFMHRYFVGFS